VYKNVVFGGTIEKKQRRQEGQRQQHLKQNEK
jgi:hypothetical protein